MKYYVVADVHGFFSEMKNALEEKGYFDDGQPHKLIICGDLLDRGNEAQKIQDFVCGLPEDEVILIRGNHEDLLDSMLGGWLRQSYYQEHHRHNGTTDSVLQLSKHSNEDLDICPYEVYRDFVATPFVKEIMPRMIDYYETKKHIFVHGWIPYTATGDGNRKYRFNPDWREADIGEWQKARWYNGMDAANRGVIENGKTIVCGHWHCSYGHSRYENDGEEFGETANFNPYVAEGIVAIDACTAYSRKVNCLVVEDEPLG